MIDLREIGRRYLETEVKGDINVLIMIGSSAIEGKGRGFAGIMGSCKEEVVHVLTQTFRKNPDLREIFEEAYANSIDVPEV